MEKKKINSFTINFEAKSENESFARAVASTFAAQLDPTVEEIADVRCAVSEGVTNAIIHGYKGVSDGVVQMIMILYDNRSMTIKIRDRGCGIADIEKCREPLYTSDPSGERGGMGFAVMECFCDKVVVQSKVGEGTTVILHKHFD